MDATTRFAIKQIDRVEKVLRNLAAVGAEEYANGRYRKSPIVDRHFTPGNQQRYGWPSLSPAYAEEKRGQGKALRAGMVAAGRKRSNYDEDDIGSRILPMLVRSGKLREAVASRTHQILKQGDVAVIVFANLPVYALAHHTGSGRLPKRSPVEPNEEDRDQVVKAMQRQLDVAIGTGGDVPIGVRDIPGQARFT